MDSNGSIVEDSIIKFAQNAKQRSVTIAPEKTKEILHYNVKMITISILMMVMMMRKR